MIPRAQQKDSFIERAKYNYRTWTICNLTPNSFSDGGELSSSKRLAAHLAQWSPHTAVWDFGAESTAPFNAPISATEELRRFKQILFPVVEQHPKLFLHQQLSIDTYHPETFVAVAKFLKEQLPQVKLIWNDVSSFLDAEVVDILDEFAADYVFCHNWAPTRMQCSDHMEFVADCPADTLIPRMATFFQQRLDNLSRLPQGNIYLDPCFGFAKDFMQNSYLLEHLSELIAQLPGHQWLIGISRKSFLRKLLQVKQLPTSNEQLDLLHLAILERLALKDCHIRLHNPAIITHLMD